MISGLVLVGLFAFLGIKDSEATFGDILPGIVLGICFFVLGIIFMIFNHKAFLCIDNGHIKGKYHLVGKIDCNISEVDFVFAQINTLSILLKNGRKYTISGVKNSFELCSAIRRSMTFDSDKSLSDAQQSLKELASKQKKYMIFTFSGLVLMFVNIFVTAILTGMRELEEFSKTDWTIMFFMGIVEIAIFIATFYFAQRTGKCIIPIQKARYDIRRTVIETKPLPPGNAIMVFTDTNYDGRITVFGFPNEASVYYTVENFNSDYTLSKIFESQIFDDIKNTPIEIEALVDITKNIQNTYRLTTV